MKLIAALIIGGCAGWLAGKIMNSKSEGVVWNIILGIVGGLAGGWLFGLLGFESASTSWLGSIITGTIGAIALIWVYRKISK